MILYLNPAISRFGASAYYDLNPALQKMKKITFYFKSRHYVKNRKKVHSPIR